MPILEEIRLDRTVPSLKFVLPRFYRVNFRTDIENLNLEIRDNDSESNNF